MTAKEKSKELIVAMIYKIDPNSLYKSEQLEQQAKQCAIIAADEILDSLNYLPLGDSLNNKDYWQEVKNELNQL
jgi:hypothetical protein